MNAHFLRAIGGEIGSSGAVRTGPTHAVGARGRLIGGLAVAALLALTGAGGCASPGVVPAGAVSVPPRLTATHARMPDGHRLAMQTFGPEPSAAGAAGVVLLGLHGFNDYRQAFAPLARQLAAAGVRTYAVDQRGFGANALAGRWHDEGRMVADVTVLLDLLRARHPGARLILAGESMGAAVAMLAVTRAGARPDGLVLIAPAVWSRAAMPWYQRAALALLARTAPALRLTGEGLRIRPSDNLDMLRAMGRDPLVVKATRVDALWGVTNLMDQAQGAAAELTGPTLLLYGENDQIIPPAAFCRLRAQLRRRPDLRLVLYRQGWHMLPRDLHGRWVGADIAAWVRDPAAALPSGEAVGLDDPRMQRFCHRP